MRFVSRNGAFCTALLGGMTLRVLAMLGYRPALWFVGDSYTYLSMALSSKPRPERPSGYPFMLRLLEPFHSFAVVVAVQHTMILAVAVMIYALLRRRGLPGWAATLIVLPVLFDAYLLQLEHLVLSDTLFIFLVTAAITLLLWRERPGVALGMAAGLLLAFAAVTRTIGIVLLVVVGGWLLVRRVSWRTLAASAAAAVLPLGLYAAWYHSYYRQYALGGADGVFLWSRTMTFAECSEVRPPANEAVLCPVPYLPRSQPDNYIWKHTSPIMKLATPRFSARTNALASDFAKRAILAQPYDYFSTVAAGVARTIRWSPTQDQGVIDRYVFARAEPSPPDLSFSRTDTAKTDMTAYDHRPDRAPRVVEHYAGWLRAYQRAVYLPGPVFGVLLLAALAGIVAAWRRWGGPALLPWTAGIALIVVPPATANFDYRYVLPAIPLVCLALGLAIPPRREEPTEQTTRAGSGVRDR
jgi:hypothetical protein